MAISSYVSEITSSFIVRYDHTPFWISAGTNKDDLEWPWMLNKNKMCTLRTACLLLDVRAMLWLAELAMHEWMTVSDKNEANELWLHTRFVRIFARVYFRGATNRSWAAKLGYYSHYASSAVTVLLYWVLVLVLDLYLSTIFGYLHAKYLYVYWYWDHWYWYWYWYL